VNKKGSSKDEQVSG